MKSQPYFIIKVIGTVYNNCPTFTIAAEDVGESIIISNKILIHHRINIFNIINIKEQKQTSDYGR